MATLARFPLGSGINGNLWHLSHRSETTESARFPLGSGINGNKWKWEENPSRLRARFPLGSGINGNY
ncbi:hypothetical protein CRC_03251 [Cylindrospermopsis raciborskii CS-505]|nr:hypothetical protein CRC_03251 [Cylindrospermopsis raciborskii CS-505]